MNIAMVNHLRRDYMAVFENIFNLGTGHRRIFKKS